MCQGSMGKCSGVCGRWAGGGGGDRVGVFVRRRWWRWCGCAWRCCSSCAFDGVLRARGWCCCAACAFWCILGTCPPVSMTSSIHPTRKANQRNHKHQLNSWASRLAACFLLQPPNSPSRCRRAPTPSSATPPAINNQSAVVPRPITAPQRPRRPITLPAPPTSPFRQHRWPASTSPATRQLLTQLSIRSVLLSGPPHSPPTTSPHATRHPAKHLADPRRAHHRTTISQQRIPKSNIHISRPARATQWQRHPNPTSPPRAQSSTPPRIPPSGPTQTSIAVRRLLRIRQQLQR